MIGSDLAAAEPGGRTAVAAAAGGDVPVGDIRLKTKNLVPPMESWGVGRQVDRKPMSPAGGLIG